MDKECDELDDHNDSIHHQERNGQEIRIQHCQLLSLVQQSHHDDQPQNVAHRENDQG